MPAKTSDTQDQATETPHYHGHRERLRERFCDSLRPRRERRTRRYSSMGIAATCLRAVGKGRWRISDRCALGARKWLGEDVQASAGEKDLQPLIAVIPPEIACPAEVDT